MTVIADHIEAKAVLKQAELALYRAGRRIVIDRSFKDAYAIYAQEGGTG